jgi:DNA-binding NtrC family response regulator/tetratricopeptide (TPR) repeat protein
MGVKGDRETPGARMSQGDASLRSILRRARIYLDAGSPGSSHELLSPLGLTGPWPDALSVEVRFEVLTLQLRGCQALGHADHVANVFAALEDLVRKAPSVRADLWAEGVLTLASVITLRGDYAQATALVNEHLDSQKAGDLPAATFVSFSVFRFDGLIRAGKVDEAEEIASLAVEKADLGNAPLPAGIARNLIANALRVRGRLLDALNVYAHAAARFTVAGDYVWLSRVHLNRAALLNTIGHVPEAHAAYEEAYRRSHEISHATNVMRSRLGLGMVSIRQGNLDTARSHLLKGWLEARRLKAPREQALALEFLGEALILMGRPVVARRALALCRRIAMRIAPEGDLIAEWGIREALLALMQGDAAVAETAATAAHACAAKAGFAWEECQALRLRGAARYRLGRRDEARSDLQAAHDKLQAMGEELEIQLVRRWLALLDGETGDEEPPIHPAQIGAAQPTRLVRTVESPSRRDPVGRAVSKRGAGDGRGMRLRSPAEPEDIERVLARLRENGLVGCSPGLLAVFQEALQFSRLRLAVLIRGETGTGKDLLAHAIHHLSPWAGGPWVPFNCSNCPRELLDAELFGHTRGAFSGASGERAGLVRSAEQGTLFLDEVGEIPADVQTKLLRFLDSGEVRSLGRDGCHRVETRVVSATNADLDAMVRDGRFRQDLLYRLASVRLVMPPLRDRREDIRLLVAHFVDAIRKDGAPRFAGFGDGALRSMEKYDWPGNVRQLRSEVFRVAALAPDGREVPNWFPPSPDEIGAPGSPVSGSTALALDPEPLTAGEQHAILKSPARFRTLMEESGGQMSVVASRLGVTRQHAHRLWKRFRTGEEEFPDLS